MQVLKGNRSLARFAENFNLRIERTKIQERPNGGRAQRPDVLGNARHCPQTLALTAYRADNADLREQIGGRDADSSGGGREFALSLFAKTLPPGPARQTSESSTRDPLTLRCTSHNDVRV